MGDDIIAAWHLHRTHGTSRDIVTREPGRCDIGMVRCCVEVLQSLRHVVENVYRRI